MLSRRTMRKANKMCTNITGIARRTLKARTAKGARKSVRALNRYGKSFQLTYLKRVLLKGRKQPGVRRRIPAYTRAINRTCKKAAIKYLLST
jgi:hypothetical protein